MQTNRLDVNGTPKLEYVMITSDREPLRESIAFILDERQGELISFKRWYSKAIGMFQTRVCILVSIVDG